MSARHALLVGNGEPPSRQLFEFLMREQPLLLCADGGADFVLEHGFPPDYVVGDLDSVSAGGLAQTAMDRLIKVDADDTGTDLQKVLRHAVDLGVGAAVLVGFTGRRTDHTLWSLGLLKSFAHRMDLCMVDDHCDIRLIDASIAFSAPIGLKLSLCPLGGPAHRIRTAGLRFPLNEESLIPGERDGISNEVVEDPVTVTVGGGDLLLVIQREEGIDPGVRFHSG